MTKSNCHAMCSRSDLCLLVVEVQNEHITLLNKTVILVGLCLRNKYLSS